jgi:hypothetical protein
MGTESPVATPRDFARLLASIRQSSLVHRPADTHLRIEPSDGCGDWLKRDRSGLVSELPIQEITTIEPAKAGMPGVHHRAILLDGGGENARSWVDGGGTRNRSQDGVREMLDDTKFDT